MCKQRPSLRLRRLGGGTCLRVIHSDQHLTGPNVIAIAHEQFPDRSALLVGDDPMFAFNADDALRYRGFGQGSEE